MICWPSAPSSNQSHLVSVWSGPLAAALFRSVAQLVIVIRQFEHYGPGALVAHFIRQHAHLGGATTPMFWIVNESDGTGHSEVCPSDGVARNLSAKVSPIVSVPRQHEAEKCNEEGHSVRKVRRVTGSAQSARVGHLSLTDRIWRLLRRQRAKRRRLVTDASL